MAVFKTVVTIELETNSFNDEVKNLFEYVLKKANGDRAGATKLVYNANITTDSGDISEIDSYYVNAVKCAVLHKLNEWTSSGEDSGTKVDADNLSFKRKENINNKKDFIEKHAEKEKDCDHDCGNCEFGQFLGELLNDFEDIESVRNELIH